MSKFNINIWDGENLESHPPTNSLEINDSLKSKYDRHREICEKLNAIYIKKNTDYDDSFGRAFHQLGMISAATRMWDKLNRVVALSKNDAQVKDEAIEDTLIDLANYAIMSLIEFEIEKNK